jgi:hypothetical protein
MSSRRSVLGITVLLALASANCGSGDLDSQSYEEVEATGSQQEELALVKPVLLEKAGEKASSWQEIGEFADKYGGYFSKAKAGLDTVNTILDFLDIPLLQGAGSEFDELSAQMNQLGSTFTWYVNALNQDQNWAALNASLTVARQQTEQHMLDDSVPQFDASSAAFASSAQLTAQLSSPMTFLRYWNPRAYQHYSWGHGWVWDTWRNLIPLSERLDGEPVLGSDLQGVDLGADDQTKQFVYDWRLGVPAMMMAIATRIQILALANPDLDIATFREELMAHRKVLLAHASRMRNGVKCKTVDNIEVGYQPHGTVEVVCADIHTGQSFGRGFPHGNQQADVEDCKICTQTHGNTNCDQVDQACVDKVNAKYAKIITDAAAAEVELRNKVLEPMPLYEMRSLANTLFFLANRSVLATPATEAQTAPRALFDLAEVQERLAANQSPSLCLDVQWGSTAEAAPLWMFTCNGTGAQRFNYDRTTESISNPASNKCLTAEPQPNGQTAKVSIKACNPESRAQRWSFDPLDKRIYNAALSTGILKGLNEKKGLVNVEREVNCPPNVFCGNRNEEYWFASQAPHKLCATGAALDYAADGLGGCAGLVIGSQASCGIGAQGAFWNSSCVSRVTSVCGQACGSSNSSF